MQQLWIVDIYGLLLAGVLTVAGALGDRVGHRRLLLLGASLFGAASVFAAFATTAGALIAGRAVLGIAAAALAPSTLALITVLFSDARQRAVAVAVWSTCFGAGAILGPTVGGVLLTWYGWGSVFLLAPPVAVVLLLAAPLLPPARSLAAPSVSFRGMAIGLAAVLPLVYGLKGLALNLGWIPVLATVVGLSCGAVYVRRQRILGAAGYRTVLLLSMCVGAVQGGALLLVNSYLQLVAGLTPLRAGLAMVPSAVAFIASSLAASRLARTVGATCVIASGLLFAAVGYGLLAVSAFPGPVGVVVAICMVMAGVGPMVSVGYHLMLSFAPPGQEGVAAATAESAGQIGIALGVAVFGSIGAAVARRSDLTGGLHVVTALAALLFAVLAAAAVRVSGRVSDPVNTMAG